MLTPELVEALQLPISESSPCGEDLEYDPDFTALAAVSEGKPEQQFGDTVIPAVEPEWRLVAEQADALLRRTKDLRVAMLLLRATTRLQGVPGFVLGVELLTGLLDKFWDGLYPLLDADDDNDPTMRLNALAPLGDESMVLRDVYNALIGVSRGVGPITVRHVAIVQNVLAPTGNEAVYSPAQVQGALEEIQAENPAAIQAALKVATLTTGIQQLVNERTGLSDALDLGGLKSIASAVHKSAVAAMGLPAEAEGEAGEEGSAGVDGTPRAAVPRGEIQTRQDALQALDRVIRFLIQTEPGNPAPLLIERAKKLIGVSFFEIMEELAPNAIDSIETVTGRRPS